MRRPNLRCFIRNAVPEHWAIVHRQAKGCTGFSEEGRGPVPPAQSFLRAVWDDREQEIQKFLEAPLHLRRRDGGHRPESLIDDARSVHAARPPQ